MTDTWDTIKVEPERDRFGRYVIHPAKGGKPKSYTRATTVAETLDDRYNLEAWKVRTTALGIVQRPDLYAAIASTPADEKQRLNKLCDQAREAAAGSAGANLGTALHRFTERLNRGEEVTVPAPWDADIAAYRAAIDASDYTIVPEYLEGIVVLDKLGVAGTFDMILRHRTIGNRIADLKTGATLDFSWGAIAVQLAIYAHADTLYDPASKTHEAMPAVDQDKAIVIHLPAGKATCTLYEVDIAAGWEAVQHAMWAREWRKRKGLATALQIVSGGASVREDEEPPAVAVPTETVLDTSTDATIVGGGEQVPADCTVEPAPPGDVDHRNALIARVKDLSDEQRQEMARRWPEGVPTFKAAPLHSEVDLDAIELVLGGIDLGGAVDNPEEGWGPQDDQPYVPPAPEWAEPDSERLTDDAYEAVKGMFEQQPVEVVSLVTQWAMEAHAAGRAFTPRDKRTERRAAILTAAVGCAAEIVDLDVVRAVIGWVAGFDMQETFTTGAALGTLTVDEARRIEAFTQHFGRDIALLYDSAGGVAFVGDGLAAVA